MIKVYLSGHIPKSGENDWRQNLIHELREYDIKFLIPTNPGPYITNSKFSHDAAATRDEMFLNECDVCVLNLDLNIGKCLGSMWEFGFLYALHKPVILINHHPEMTRTKFLEHKSNVVVRGFDDAISILIYMVS